MPATLITLAKFTSPPGFSNIVPAPFGNLIAIGGDLFGTAADGDQVASGSVQVPADANPGPSWHAIGAGVEGTASDILFQSTSGQTAIWDMNGTSIAGGGQVSANAGPSWKAISLGL